MNPDHDVPDSSLISALERKPVIPASADFHSRLMASLPAESMPRPARPLSFARVAAYFASACLAVILIVLTSTHPDAISTPSGMPFVLELIVLTQLMAVGYWLGTRREG